MAGVGLDQGAVQQEMAVAGGLRRAEGPFQGGRPDLEHVDPLLEVAVAGAAGQAIARGELADADAVDEPAQHHHRLPERGEQPGRAARAAVPALGGRQTYRTVSPSKARVASRRHTTSPARR
ncbi:hypothetical protein [Streptomyces sediminimaris]|uniref:hypothetical protein n=1 Tax=Streptomyces sediminimaris TaxID=3383721 RepID=UPI00399A379C